MCSATPIMANSITSFHVVKAAPCLRCYSSILKWTLKSSTTHFQISRKLNISAFRKKYSLGMPAISSSNTKTAISSSGFIPLSTIALVPPQPATEQSLISSLVIEPTFTDIGLGGLSPSGLIQNGLELLHVGLDLPWWGCIAVGVLTVRVVLFPLVVKAQQNAAKMSNNIPQMQILQQKLTDARLSGNAIQSAQIAHELQTFMKEKQLSPLRNLMLPLIQAPVFMSFFFALKGMSNIPVESMKEGGLFWFADLTICDPYYILPLLTSVTMWATIELGTDSARLSAQGSPLFIYFLRTVPFIMFPITMNFSGAILCYWLTTNVISLLQVSILRIPKVRKYFRIEQLVPIKPEAKNLKKKTGFMESIKEAWTNQKIASEINERQRVAKIQFRRAGTEPAVKTYLSDPGQKEKETFQKNCKKS